jgi:hypothetical protein
MIVLNLIVMLNLNITGDLKKNTGYYRATRAARRGARIRVRLYTAG